MRAAGNNKHQIIYFKSHLRRIMGTDGFFKRTFSRFQHKRSFSLSLFVVQSVVPPAVETMGGLFQQLRGFRALKHLSEEQVHPPASLKESKSVRLKVKHERWEKKEASLFMCENFMKRLNLDSNTDDLSLSTWKYLKLSIKHNVIFLKMVYFSSFSESANINFVRSRRVDA